MSEYTHFPTGILIVHNDDLSKSAIQCTLAEALTLPPKESITRFEWVGYDDDVK